MGGCVKHVFGYWNNRLYFNTPVKEFVKITSEKGEIVCFLEVHFAKTEVDVSLSNGKYVVRSESDFGGCNELLRVEG